jgi:uncharacterized protein (TIGR02466 family)
MNESVMEQQRGAVSIDTKQLFATPVVQAYWPDSGAMNAALKEAVLERMRSSPGVVYTNRGGWHSNPDLHTWHDACVKEFLDRIHFVIRELVDLTVPEPSEEHLTGWTIRAWANVNGKGAYNREHQHEGSGTLWSAFYYVDTGLTDAQGAVSGCTVLQDRSRVPKEILRNCDPYDREIRITPRAGLMVVFPAGLYHYVEPYLGDDLRISLAFNLKNPKFVIPYYEGMQELDWWWTNFRGLMVLPSKLGEKCRALALLPAKLGEGSRPASFAPAQWRECLLTAWDRATAEASSRNVLNWGRVYSDGTRGKQ